MDFAAIRTQSTATAHGAGFSFATWLPPSDSAEVRPKDEILDRWAALALLFCYVVAPEHVASTDDIEAFVDRHGLRSSLTEDERAILDLPRTDAADGYRDTIGWKLENMIPLAWALGRGPEPSIDGHMIQEVNDLVFTPFPEDPTAFDRGAFSLRPAQEICQLEDLFYCVHNAVRCAQVTPPDQVPEGGFVPVGFNPLVNGGVIHERRHALTWMLSPGVAWDATDLST